MSDALPILFSFRRCPYAMRARLALAVSEQSVVLREVELRNRPPELVEVSPKATVPVLILPEGRVLEESREIMLWTLANRDPEGWLLSDSAQCDLTEQLLAECDGDFKYHLDRYKYENRYENVDSIEHREAASEWLRKLDSQLASSSFLFGARTSFADMAIAPFVRQFAFADRDWFDAQSWSGLRAWLDEFIESALFARVMSKYASWRAGDEELVVRWSG